jgi:hypothetical protein
MGYAKLNIWIRYADCRLVTDQWQTDLVIKTCGSDGTPLVDMDPTVIEKLQARYPDYQTVAVRDYEHERRIQIYPGGRPRRLFSHVEVDVPPGCYVVWTRVCYGHNEETNKVMVTVRCGEEACLNLLLDAVETCGRNFVHPGLARGVDMDLPEAVLQHGAQFLMAVAGKEKGQVLEELGQRLEEARMAEDKDLEKRIHRVREIVEGVAGE